LSIYVVHNWPKKLPQKLLDEKIDFFPQPNRFTVIQMPQNGALGISGLIHVGHKKDWNCHCSSSTDYHFVLIKQFHISQCLQLML
jgi:hypothetical protein